MTDQDAAARREQILASLAQSREELRQLLDPERIESAEGASGDHADGFPRSRTMQMLLTGRGLGTLAAVAGGLFIARPRLALRLIRMLPASAVARWAVVRAVSALRGKGAMANGSGANGTGVDAGVNRASPGRSDSGRHPPA